MDTLHVPVIENDADGAGSTNLRNEMTGIPIAVVAGHPCGTGFDVVKDEGDGYRSPRRGVHIEGNRDAVDHRQALRRCEFQVEIKLTESILFETEGSFVGARKLADGLLSGDCVSHRRASLLVTACPKSPVQLQPLSAWRRLDIQHLLACAKPLDGMSTSWPQTHSTLTKSPGPRSSIRSPMGRRIGIRDAD